MHKLKYILLFLVICNFIFSEENCDGSICFITEQNGKYIDFIVKNRDQSDITITVEFSKFVNLNSSEAFPFTESIEGDKSQKIFSLLIADMSKPFSYYYNYFWEYGSIYAKHDDTYVYRLPYEKTGIHKVGQGYNGKFSHYGPNQYAIDWDMDEGTEVLAARGGVVVGTKDTFSETGTEEKYKEMVNYVMIRHDDGTIGEYDHFKYKGIVVKTGDKIIAGGLLGYSGNVGYSSGPHLHFIVFTAVDGKTRKSIPVKFKISDDPKATLIEGKYYSEDPYVKK